VALYLRTIAPVGEGLTGRGMEHPPPLSRRVTEDVFPCEQSINPRLPAATAASSRPLQGAGSKWRLARWPCPGEQELW